MLNAICKVNRWSTEIILGARVTVVVVTILNVLIKKIIRIRGVFPCGSKVGKKERKKERKLERGKARGNEGASGVPQFESPEFQ